VRRVGRFAHLALIGAGRCLNGLTPPADTATYFTSGRGDLETTLDVLAEMCVHDRAPSPYAFVNTVGNSACFHVATSFGLRGRSQFVTSLYAPLESALRLAAIDMAEAGVTTALVGSADMCTAPLGAHRARIGVAADTPVGEGSHWLLLAAGDTAEPSLGVIRSVRSFPDEVALLRQLRERGAESRGAVLACGQHLPPDRWDRCREAAGCRDVFDYREGLPWYDSQTGHGLHRFLTEANARTLIHIDGDPSGRSTLLVIEATPPRASIPRRRPPDPRTGE
jgi:hypothetical protein